METKNKKNTQGFTLIELLVVIAIIGLLASVVLVSLSSTRLKARDARRVADMNQLIKAFELYFNSTYSYPTLAVSGPLSTLTGLTPTYLATMPQTITPNDGGCNAGPGPGTNDYYFYANNNGGTAATYSVTFCLGTAVNVLPKGPHTVTQAGFQ